MINRPHSDPSQRSPLLLFGIALTLVCLLLFGMVMWAASAYRSGAVSFAVVPAMTAALLLTLVVGSIGLLTVRRWQNALGAAVAERERAETTLRRAEEYQRVFRQANDVILIVDPLHGLVLDANHRACESYDIPREMFIGRDLASIMHDTRHMEARFRTLLSGDSSQEFESVHFSADGTPIDFLINASAIDFQGRRAVLSIQRDITERKALEQQLSHQAFHDSLTGLANRALFRDRVEHAVSRGVRHPSPLVVIFLDLDNFKTINDSLGHAAGDELLIQVSQRLRKCLRITDTVARLGGDEFAMLLEHSKHPEDSVAVAERITAELSLPFVLEEKEVFVGTSIGICSTVGGDSADELLRNADVAMYIAKNKGKGCYEVFEPHMHAAVLERLDLEADLRHALERAELVLHYHPIVVLRDGRLTGFEALLRWQHPTRGLIAPGVFIPIAEETGLMVPIGRWVLEEACRQAREWRQTHAGARSLTITVNVSGREFHHADLADTVVETLETTGLPAGALILELTETVLMQQAKTTLARLQTLKEIGVRLALDDFGTGYSNLSYLQRFPIDILKIDRSFVDGIGSESADGSALARAIIALGDSLRIDTVAEGVRSREQSVALQALGCEFGQGFFFARPLDAAAAGALLARDGEMPRLRGSDDRVAAPPLIVSARETLAP